MMALREHLGRPVDIASLAFFRIAAGLLLAFEISSHLYYGSAFEEYVSPAFHFSYPFFSWLRPLSPAGMSLLWSGAVVLALAVAAGAFTRITAPLLFLVWTTLFLMQRSLYVNHTYLYCWMTFWLAVLPVGRAASIDVWLHPERRVASVPAWMREILLLQMAIVYFFAGIAKLDPDWLSGTLQRLWFPNRRSLDVLEPMLRHWLAPYVIAWGGVAFDLAIVPALLWRRTRRLAFAVAIVFHVSNAAILRLWSFPWFSIAVTTLFLDPSWPRRIPGLRRLMPPRSADEPAARGAPISVPLSVGLALYALFHVLFPLRQHLYPGDVAWTEAGSMFSWRMMARTKQGKILFRVVDPATGKMRTVNPGTMLTPMQRHKLPGEPDMILQVAHAIAAEEARAGRPGARVFAWGLVHLNGRRQRALVDPRVDLAREEWTWQAWPWLRPSPRDATDVEPPAATEARSTRP